MTANHIKFWFMIDGLGHTEGEVACSPPVGTIDYLDEDYRTILWGPRARLWRQLLLLGRIESHPESSERKDATDIS